MLFTQVVLDRCFWKLLLLFIWGIPCTSDRLRIIIKIDELLWVLNIHSQLHKGNTPCVMYICLTLVSLEGRGRQPLWGPLLICPLPPTSLTSPMGARRNPLHWVDTWWLFEELNQLLVSEKGAVFVFPSPVALWAALCSVKALLERSVFLTFGSMGKRPREYAGEGHLAGSVG